MQLNAKVDNSLLNEVKQSTEQQPFDVPKKVSKIRFNYPNMLLDKIPKEIYYELFQDKPMEPILGKQLKQQRIYHKEHATWF